MAQDDGTLTGDSERADVVAHVADIDWFLQDIILLAEIGLELGVTLTVAGGVISGTLIRGEKYFAEMSEAVRNATSSNLQDGTLEDVATRWASYTEMYHRPKDADEDWLPPSATFVHLRNARFYAPGQALMPQTGVLWRGRLSAISGFFIGSFAPRQ